MELNLTLGDFGFQATNNHCHNKVFLQQIINNSSEKQLNACADVIVALLKHV